MKFFFSVFSLSSPSPSVHLHAAQLPPLVAYCRGHCFFSLAFSCPSCWSLATCSSCHLANSFTCHLASCRCRWPKHLVHCHCSTSVKAMVERWLTTPLGAECQVCFPSFNLSLLLLLLLNWKRLSDMKNPI